MGKKRLELNTTFEAEDEPEITISIPEDNYCKQNKKKDMGRKTDSQDQYLASYYVPKFFLCCIVIISRQRFILKSFC